MTALPATVLYVSYDGLLEPLGESQVVAYVEALALRGTSLAVLSFEKPGDLGDDARVEAMRTRLSRAAVDWIPLRYHRSPSLPATAYDVAGGVRAARSYLRGRRVALVHGRGYTGGLIAVMIARRSDARFLFDMRGFWVDERIEAGQWAEASLLVRGLRALEKRLLAEADAIVSLTEAGAEALPSLAPGVALPRVEVIPTCVDLERFQPAEDAGAVRRRLGLGEGLLLVYSGSLSMRYLGPLTMRVGKRFEEEGGRFVVLTREVELASRMAEAEGVHPLIRSLQHEEVPEWLSAMDAGLALMRPGPATRASAPTKVGEYLASGMAVAATVGVGDLETQLGGEAVGVMVRPDDAPQAVAGRLLEAARRPERMAKAQGLAERHYSLNTGVEGYLALYRELGGG